MLDLHYEVQLAKAENGLVARCGCKVFVFTTWEELNTELTAYFTGKETELIKKYAGFDQPTTAVRQPC